MTIDSESHARFLPVSAWVEQHVNHLPRFGRILDLACGGGRHARFLVAKNYAVVAVDRDSDAVAALRNLPGVDARIMDLEGDEWPLSGESFAGIVVTNYLWRPRLADLLGLLAPGGVLIYETFMAGHGVYGKPSRADFLLQPGELRSLVAAAGLREIDFVEGYVAQPKPAMRQAICAVRD